MKVKIVPDRLLCVEAAFDSTPDAALLVDSEAVVLAANAAARKMLANRDGIYIQSERLRLGDRFLEARLYHILKGIATAAHLHRHASRRGALRVPSASGETDFLLQVFPVEQKLAGAAVIFMSTTASSHGPAESDLAHLFDLSPMQRRIALRLLEERPARKVAEDLGISRNTFKTHLRRLYLKLGVSRQTELVRLLSKLKVQH
jgi:DNA-binding CsgD family transcriptional regulator